jgi:hypothetical protein
MTFLVLALVSLALPGVTVNAVAAPNGSQVVASVDEPVIIQSASGCTGSFPDARRCINVQGSGLRIDNIWTTWDRSLTLCNTRMHITYFDSNGNQYKQHNSALKEGCRFGDSYQPGGYPYTARAGKVCGTVSVNGVKKSGACVNIFR